MLEGKGRELGHPMLRATTLTGRRWDFPEEDKGQEETEEKEQDAPAEELAEEGEDNGKLKI